MDALKTAHAALTVALEAIERAQDDSSLPPLEWSQLLQNVNNSRLVVGLVVRSVN